MFVLNGPLREGEPEADGAIIDQPEPQEPASVPVEPASEVVIDDEPVEEAESQPVEPPEDQPVVDELSDDDWNALKERYPDKFKVETPKEPEPPKKESDPYFRALDQQRGEAYSRIAAAQAKIAAGDFPDDPDVLAADLELAGEWQAASERRGQLHVARLLTERALGIDAQKLDVSDEIQSEYGDLLDDLETAQVNAFRLRKSAAREFDPQKRNAIITKALNMDASAVGDFYRRAMDLAVAHGKRVGKAEIEKTVGKRMEQTAAQARSNGNIEAHAKAKALVAAGTAMSTATSQKPSKASDNSLSGWERRIAHEGEEGYPELSASDWAQYQAVRRASGL